MPDVCDHTSVGMLVWRQDKLLLIERRKFPFGFAPPAGHVDGDASFEAAAARELQEEVGLESTDLELAWEGRRENACRRTDGTWHYWKIYRAAAAGRLERSRSETKRAGWYAQEEIANLAKRTQAYLRGEIAEEEWQQSPGLETFWYGFFAESGLLQLT